MIVRGYLSPLRTRGGRAKADLKNLHVRGGEFIASEVEGAMDTDALVSAACAEIVEQTRDRNSVLIFTSGVSHCRHVAAEIERMSGRECGVITGNTPSGERTELIARFKGEKVADGLFEKKLQLPDAEPWDVCQGPSGNQFYLVTRNEKGNLGRVYLIERHK
jgi:DNA repair protein RadD